MNDYLLDTHVLIWLLGEPEKIASEAIAAITSGSRWFSVASIWEMSIKQATGQLKMPDDLPDVLDANQIQVLNITTEHALATGRLPLIHRDPFDRMLVAQTQIEQLTLVTRDQNIMRYDVRTMPA